MTATFRTYIGTKSQPNKHPRAPISATVAASSKWVGRGGWKGWDGEGGKGGTEDGGKDAWTRTGRGKIAALTAAAAEYFIF